MAKISVIVPVYNAEKYLDDCVQSILAQELKDWELFLVNDGSSDNSLAICRKYETQDNRIHVLDGPNNGASTARNRGLNAAQGKYVGFIDADDFVAPQMYRKMVELADKNQAELVLCEYYYWKNGKLNPGKTLPMQEKIIADDEQTILALLKQGGRTANGSIYCREWIERYRIRFITTLEFAEDTRYIYTAAFNAHRVVYCPDRLYFCRMGEQSTTGHYMQNLESNSREVIKWLFQETVTYPNKDEMAEEIWKLQALYALYTIFNVCKDGTPYSLEKRFRYAKELAENPYYKRAVTEALKNKSGSKITYIQCLTLRYHMTWIDVIYYSWIKRILLKVLGVKGRFQR